MSDSCKQRCSKYPDFIIDIGVHGVWTPPIFGVVVEREGVGLVWMEGRGKEKGREGRGTLPDF